MSISTLFAFSLIIQWGGYLLLFGIIIIIIIINIIIIVFAVITILITIIFFVLGHRILLLTGVLIFVINGKLQKCIFLSLQHLL